MLRLTAFSIFANICLLVRPLKRFSLVNPLKNNLVITPATNTATVETTDEILNVLPKNIMVHHDANKKIKTRHVLKPTHDPRHNR